ncbi:hypothetical protein ACGFXC_06335 [Streptomyces sp. NPDC048507]|uniref:hypothetical protein n=1 Tax=Streptomyces sp. NPDC048507 TaxID=3365560 RepID=UPI003712755F
MTDTAPAATATRDTARALDRLDGYLAAGRLDAIDSAEARWLLSGIPSLLVPWVTRLVTGGDPAPLHLLYEENTGLHDALASDVTLLQNRRTTGILREASGLTEAFDDEDPVDLLAVRVQAALGLELLAVRPDPRRTATVLRWYEEARSTPRDTTVPWSPEGLAAGDARLREALDRLVTAAGPRATGGPAFAAALALAGLARRDLPGRARRPISLRVLFDLQGVGAAGNLSMTLHPHGPRGLVPDPATLPLFAGDEDFGQSLTHAWATAGNALTGTVVWSLHGIDLAERGARPPAQVVGPSLGAAFAVLLGETARIRVPAARGNGGAWLRTALRLSVAIRRVNADRAVTGGVSARGELTAVDGFRPKLRAARGLKLVVVAEPDGPVARAAARELPDGPPRPEVLTAARWEAALRKARSWNGREMFKRGLVLALVLAVVAGGIGTYQWREQRHQRVLQQAKKMLNEADTVRASDPARALRLALAAYHRAPDTAGLDSLLRTLLQSRYRGELPPGSGDRPALEAVGYTNAGRTFLTREPGRITVWDTASRASVATLGTGAPDTEPKRPLRDTGQVLLPLSSPAGAAVLVGMRDRTAELWTFEDPAHPRRLAVLPGGVVLQAAVSGDGRILATAGPVPAPAPVPANDPDAQETVTLWNVEKPDAPRRLGELPVTAAQRENGLIGISVDVTGRRAAVADTRAVHVHDLTRDGFPETVTIDPGQYTASADPRPGGGGQINPNTGVAFSRTDGTLLYTTTSHPLAAGFGMENRFVDLWQLDGDTPRLVDAVRGANVMVPGPRGGGATVDQTGVSLIGSDVVLRTNGADRASSGPDSPEDPLFTYSPDGTRLAVCGEDRVVRFWDVADLRGAMDPGPVTPYTAAAHAPGNGLLALNQLVPATRKSEREVALYDTAAGTPYRRRSAVPAADLIAIDHDGTRLALLDGDVLSVWDVQDPGRPRRLKVAFPLPADVRPPPDGPGNATGLITGLMIGRGGRFVVAVLSGGREALVWTVGDEGVPAGPPARITGESTTSSAGPADRGPGAPMDDDTGFPEDQAPSIRPTSASIRPTTAEEYSGEGDGAGDDEQTYPAPSTPAPSPAASSATAGAGVRPAGALAAGRPGPLPAAVGPNAAAAAPAPTAPAPTGSDDRGAALSADDRLLVLGGGPADLAVWDLENPAKPRRRATVRSGAAGGLLFAEDGRVVRVGTEGWDLRDPDAPRQVGALPVPQGNTGMQVVGAGDWGAIAVTTGLIDLTVWFVRPGTEPFRVGYQSSRHFEALGLAPGRVLIGNVDFVREHDATSVVRLARDPRAAACAVVGDVEGCGLAVK